MSPRVGPCTLLLESHSYPHQGADIAMRCHLSHLIPTQNGRNASEAEHVLLEACRVHIGCSAHEEGVGGSV